MLTEPLYASATRSGLAGAADFTANGTLVLDRLSKSFEGHQAVKDLSFTVRPGEFVTILGASGSGKTTTLMLINGVLQPDSGAVLVDGVDITHLPPYRRNLGTVYQNYSIFPHLTVARNVAFGLEMRRVSRATIERRVAEVLGLVRLSGLGDRYPQQLSGGQQQRVALARALAFQPSILLMDEPLGALDRKLRLELQSEIKKIQRDLNVTIVNVTHDQEEALTMSDSIVVVNDGCIEQHAPPREIYERPASLFVADFIGASNLISGRVTRALEHGLFEFVSATGNRYEGSATKDWAGETSASLLLRPETIDVMPLGEGGESKSSHFAVDGTVVGATYVGSLLKWEIALDNADRLAATQPNVNAEALRAGDRVRASWRPQSAWIVPRRP